MKTQHKFTETEQTFLKLKALNATNSFRYQPFIICPKCKTPIKNKPIACKIYCTNCKKVIDKTLIRW